MKDSIGSYLRSKLRSKNISNRRAGLAIGLSESAFEKILVQNDIYASRLVKLSELLNENLFQYYYNTEPFRTFLEAEKYAQVEDLKSLADKSKLQQQVIDSNAELIETQRKYIKELESKKES